jgi:formamidopyrimidine-DNA glycosylase
MPELPEVETVMRGLDRVLTGQKLRRVVVARPDLRFPFPEGLEQRLTGARVLGFRRRAKYMLMRVEGGDSLLIHLGMSGRMVAHAIEERPDPPPPHEHFALQTDGGVHVGFVDPRRFGCIDLVPTPAEDEHRLLRGLGPEPLAAAFTPSVLSAALAARRTSIKAALLDQKVVAGLGNIYVSEALHRAGISPLREACDVAGAPCRKLVPAIKRVLAESIAAGGSSLRDYVRADGGLGFFQEKFKVYDRAGQECGRCPGARDCQGIKRIVQHARATFYCPRFQR